MLGADYFGKGLIAPALEELLKAIELNPDNADAQHLLGLVFLRKGADAEGLATRTSCLKGDELKLEKAERDEQFKKAEERFKLAVKIRPDFSEALNSLAVVSLHFDRFDEAIKYAQQALANITYREAFMAEGNLALAYLNKREYARAAKELRQALFVEPRFCVGRYRLARVYFEQKEYDRAKEELDKVTNDKACGMIQEAFHLAGMVALHQQDRETAHAMFERCVQIGDRSCLAQECRIAR